MTVITTIAEMQAILLTEAESHAFAEAVLAPRESTPRLKAAAKRYTEGLTR